MAAALALALPPGHMAVSLGTPGTVYPVRGTPTAEPTGAGPGSGGAGTERAVGAASGLARQSQN